MKLQRHCVWLVATLFGHETAVGQETFGPSFSNYTPSTSVLLNPSSMLDAKTWLDIDIVGAGSYLNNDLVYLRHTKIPTIIKAQTLSENDIQFDQSHRKYGVYSRTFANTLLGTLSWRDHAFGIHIGARAYADVRRVDNIVSHFIENGVSNYYDQHLNDYEIRRLRVNALAYAQAQISYAYTFKKSGKEMFMAGFSFKKIFPVAGGAVSINEMGYNVRDEVQMSFFYLTGDMMGAISPEFSWRGGWGLDLGFTYQKMYDYCENYYPNSRKSGCKKYPYKWKLGVSLIDLGYAKFNPENVAYVGYDFNSYEFFNYAEVDINADNFQDIVIDAETSPNIGLIRNPHKMKLPGALSVQIDWNLKKNFLYLNLSWLHGIPPTRGAFGPRRAHWLSLTPRIETKWFEFALPLSVYEYRKMQLGMSLRLYFLTIGTDKLGSWLWKADMYGTDIYAMMKLPLFRSPRCLSVGGGKFGNKKKRKGGRGIPHCDAYY